MYVRQAIELRVLLLLLLLVIVQVVKWGKWSRRAVCMAHYHETSNVLHVFSLCLKLSMPTWGSHTLIVPVTHKTVHVVWLSRWQCCSAEGQRSRSQDLPAISFLECVKEDVGDSWVYSTWFHRCRLHCDSERSSRDTQRHGQLVVMVALLLDVTYFHMRTSASSTCFWSDHV